MVGLDNHTDRRSVLKKATAIATFSSIAGCTGSDDGDADGGGSDGSDGGAQTTQKDDEDRYETFTNDIDQPVGATWEAVQELAKDEDELKITSSSDPEDFWVWMDGFDGPVVDPDEINYVTGDGTKLAVRDVQSYRSGNPETSGTVGNSGVIAWQEEGLAMELSEDYAPAYGQIDDKYKTEYMLGQRLKSGAIFYNDQMLDTTNDEDVISDWMEFVQNDRWTDNLGWDPTPNWGLMGSLLESFGEEFFDHLHDRQPEWTDSHTDLVRFVAAGRYPASFSYADKVLDVAPEETEMEIATSVPLPSTTSGAGVASFAPAPNKMLIVLNYLGTDRGQKYMSKTHQSVKYGMEGYPESQDWPIGDVVVGVEQSEAAKEVWQDKDLGAGAAGA